MTTLSSICFRHFARDYKKLWSCPSCSGLWFSCVLSLDQHRVLFFLSLYCEPSQGKTHCHKYYTVNHRKETHIVTNTTLWTIARKHIVTNTTLWTIARKHTLSQILRCEPSQGNTHCHKYYAVNHRKETHIVTNTTLWTIAKKHTLSQILRCELSQGNTHCHKYYP